ncbi:hypothetical protein BS78_06G230800, partial [Paspalum vaginatum]
HPFPFPALHAFPGHHRDPCIKRAGEITTARSTATAAMVKAAALLLAVAALLLLAPCNGSRELKESRGVAPGGGSSGEQKDTGLPLIPPVLGPVLPLPPVVPGLPPARKSDKSP